MSGNYLEFRDYFQLDTQPFQQFKDDYAGAFKPMASRAGMGGEPAPGGLNGVSGAVGLYARMIATHAGVVINNRMYRPDKMKEGVGTFTTPFLKPVLLHHQSSPGLFGGNVSDPIGRVVSARYVDTSQSLRDSLITQQGSFFDLERNYVDRIAAFANGQLSLQDAIDVARWLVSDAVAGGGSEYLGLGHIELIMNITDENAVAKFMDKRYLTGSVGARTDAAICSICKQDWVKDGFCDHEPGQKYDGILCFSITGNLTYGEFSIVNVPADPYAQVLELSLNGGLQHREIQNAQNQGSGICQIPWQVMLCNQEGVSAMDFNDSQESGNSVAIIGDVSTDLTSVSSVTNLSGVENDDSTIAQPDAQSASSVEASSVSGDPLGVSNAFDASATDQSDPKLLLDKVFANDELSDDDCYALYLHMTDGFEEKKPDVDWDKLGEEMETYAINLDGDDEMLAGEGAKDQSGGSNVGEYKKSDGPFCGPSGGAPKGTYPVGTKKRASAALAYARHAPNPSGIRKCVCKHWPDLPACKQGKTKDFLDNMRLSRDELNSLPRSKFCGPFKTFPITDLSHYFAAVKMLDGIEGELRDKIFEKIERKGKALGIVALVSLQAENTSPIFDASKIVKVEDFSTDQLKSIMEHVSKSLGSTLGGCADKQDLERENELLMQEISDLEEQLGELHDKINVLELKYDAALHDVYSQQDRQVDERKHVRDLKARYLQLLSLVTKREKKNITDFIDLNEDAIDIAIAQAEGVVDIEKISSKLDDGMARIPDGVKVENPIIVDSGQQIQNLNTGKHLSADDAKKLAEIESTYHTLLYSKGAGVAKAYIVHLQKQGILPKETKEE